MSCLLVDLDFALYGRCGVPAGPWPAERTYRHVMFLGRDEDEPPPPVTTADRAVAMLDAGRSQAETARLLGISATRVFQIRARHGRLAAIKR